MLMYKPCELILWIPIGDHCCDLSAPTQMGVCQIVRCHLEMSARGVHAAQHDLIVQHQLPDEFGAGDRSGCWPPGMPVST